MIDFSDSAIIDPPDSSTGSSFCTIGHSDDAPLVAAIDHWYKLLLRRSLRLSDKDLGVAGSNVDGKSR